MKKLAIITTHPIQYYAPIFRLLHQRNKIDVKVFYTAGDQGADTYDPGFGKSISWDVPLLDGYPFEWAVNTAAKPGSHHFSGIQNPCLIERIDNYRPDALLVFGWAYQSHLKVLRHYHNRLPVYFRGDSTLLDEKGLLKPLLKKWFLRWVYRHIDHAFYTGTENKRYFKQYDLLENQLTFAPHAVDNSRFAEDRSAEADALRSRFGIKPNSILILFAGKLEPKKDPMLLQSAFLDLGQKNIHLLFAGNGFLEANLKSQVSNLKSANIHFIDFQNQTQMPVLYQACDLFCLPSKGPGETWGLAVNEAMACGRAVLISNKVGSAIDLVRPGINGYIFKSGNLNHLREKLEHLTTDKRMLSQFGKKSAELIKTWNFTAITLAIEKLIAKENPNLMRSRL